VFRLFVKVVSQMLTTMRCRHDVWEPAIIDATNVPYKDNTVFAQYTEAMPHSIESETKILPVTDNSFLALLSSR
jgi:hypothetical protein